MTLYEINEQIDALTEQMIDEETGEINEEIMKQLEQLEVDRDEKIEACGIIMKNLANEIEAIRKEEGALKARREAKANKYDRIAEYVKYALKGEKFETPKVAFSYRRTKKVEVINEELIPEDYRDYKTTWKPVRTKIKEALKGGETVPGCVLVENMNLQLK